MFPTVKPTKFTFEIEEILKHFSSEINSDLAKKNFPKLHKDNAFNKRFSAVLSNFSDVNSVTERLTENIQASMNIERQLQKDEKADKEIHIKSSKLTSQNKSDLKILYVNTKIFLDEYTSMLCWIFGWRGIENSSITKFYKSLEKYNGNDSSILFFKEKCFAKIKDVDDNITLYRDKKVVHDREKHKEPTVWFMNEMNGAIRFAGGNMQSLTPQEILFIAVEYIDCSSRFCIEWLSSQISSEVIGLGKD